MTIEINKPTFKLIKIFSSVDLTKANKKAKDTEDKHSIVFKTKRAKVSKNYKEELITIHENTSLEVQDGSIQSFINECHPEIKEFIGKNHPKSYSAKCGQLTIITRNSMRIIVTTMGQFNKHVKITDKDKNILFDNITGFQFKHIENDNRIKNIA